MLSRHNHNLSLNFPLTARRLLVCGGTRRWAAEVRRQRGLLVEAGAVDLGLRKADNFCQICPAQVRAVEICFVELCAGEIGSG